MLPLVRDYRNVREIDCGAACFHVRAYVIIRCELIRGDERMPVQSRYAARGS